jgi:hypothetical protein
MMICKRMSMVLAASLFFGAAVPVTAETVELGETRVVRSDAGSIAIGATVKLQLKNGERLKAVLFAADETAIRVKPATRRPEPSRRIAYDAIQKIERYEDRVSLGKYAGVGAAIGAGVLLSLLALAAGS